MCKLAQGRKANRGGAIYWSEGKVRVKVIGLYVFGLVNSSLPWRFVALEHQVHEYQIMIMMQLEHCVQGKSGMREMK